MKLLISSISVSVKSSAYIFRQEDLYIMICLRLWFRYDSFERKFRRNCPGEGSWHAQISREFPSFEDAISALKNTEQKHILVIFL